MGCGSSKMEAEVAVRRCKARKHHMKRAVTHRHAFAAAYALYSKSLKSTGAAIRQFADVAVSKDKDLASTSLPPPPHIQTLPNLRPPPQPPEDPLLRRAPLPRATSLPPIPLQGLVASPLKTSLATHPQALSEDEEEEDEDEDDSDEDLVYSQQQHKPTNSEPYFGLLDNILVPEASTLDNEDFELKSSIPETRSGRNNHAEQGQLKPQMPVSQTKTVVEGNLGMDRELRKQPKAAMLRGSGKSTMDLGTILHLLDDLFLESYVAGREVSQLLEAHRDYHHVPKVDERYGIKEHNSKVSKILTWTRPESPSPNEEKKEFPNDTTNLASTLDGLHAWEKKLYDEVKAAESTKLELDRKSAQLKSRKERGEAGAVIERTKTLVKSLHTKYIVEFEAENAAISEIKKLRDDYLYNRLMSLLEALRKTWLIMFHCHKQQVPLAEELQDVEITLTVKETNDLCKKIIDDLEREVTSWRESLEKMVASENECIMALLDWLHLNAQQIESDVIDNLATANGTEIPLYGLCQAWADALKQLSAEGILGSLRRFSAILHEMGRKQADEIKQKKRKEDLYRDLEKKRKAFEAFESKFKERGTVKEVAEGLQELSRHPVQERRALIDLLEKSVAEEEQRHAKLCEENVALIFQSLKEGLPDVIHNMMAFSEGCARRYGALHDNAKSVLQKPAAGGS